MANIRKRMTATITIQEWNVRGQTRWADTGSATRVAAALGLSEDVLLKNYMALVIKAQAQEFWQLPGGNK